MRIATYNVLGLRGYPPENAQPLLGDEDRRVRHFCEVFAGLGADVLALQEGPALPLMRRIAERLQRHLASFPSPTAYPGYLLSRSPIAESRVFSHPGPGAGEGPYSRSAGAARLEVGGQTLWVVAVHLHPRDRALRQREAQVLTAHLDAIAAADRPSVVLGDCNSPIEEPLHQTLAGRGFVNAMRAVGGGIVPTMDTHGVRSAAIDHIYVSGPIGPALSAARVVRDPGFRSGVAPDPGAWVHSDHLPVIADLAWPPA